jgi:fructose-specific phosphotransferase system IIC component
MPAVLVLWVISFVACALVARHYGNWFEAMMCALVFGPLGIAIAWLNAHEEKVERHARDARTASPVG